MGTVFVAYGEADSRTPVLEFALERAAAAGDEIFVHHILESTEDSADAVREEVASIVARVAPEVPYNVRIDNRGVSSDASNVSRQKRLTDAILQDDREYAYVVMGNVERGAIEELAMSSMTEAVLDSHEVPVLLVPV